MCHNGHRRDTGLAKDWDDWRCVQGTRLVFPLVSAKSSFLDLLVDSADRSALF